MSCEVSGYLYSASLSNALSKGVGEQAHVSMQQGKVCPATFRTVSSGPVICFLIEGFLIYKVYSLQRE